MARILYVDHYAGSPRHGMEYRPYCFAREWQKLGHDVTIVAASFAHVRQVNPSVSAELQLERVDGIDYFWIRTPKYTGNGAQRAINIFAFVGKLLRYSRKVADACRPEVVIASSTYPIDIYPCWRIARRYGAKLVFELHDLWPLSPIEIGGMSRWHPFAAVMQMGENFACTRSDFVVSILPKAFEYLVDHGLDASRFVHIPNGVVLDDWSELAPSPLAKHVLEQFAGLTATGYFIVTYAGAHGPANNLQLLIEAARQMRGDAVMFCLFGAGSEKEALKSSVRSLGLNNVRFFDPVPKSAIPSVLRASSALFFSLTPSPLFRYGISPNKLIDYMMAGRPIIAAVSAGNNPVVEHECGLSVGATDVNGVVQGVRKLMEMGDAARDRMGEAGHRAVLEEYSYQELAERFARCFV